MSIIRNLRYQFIQEALSSPILFSDLANMEKYISESYQMRSIIELLQNADDAVSDKFKIVLHDSTLFVANNGREFSEEDVISICRSGASTKKNKDLYIGYRGIGFKSVVNFAKTIHIVSNELALTFSKELTAKHIKDKNLVGEVPLIRVPHEFTYEEKYQKTIDSLQNDGYSVIFIFDDVQMDVIVKEIRDYSPNTLLFLKHVNEVIFDTSDKQNYYRAIRTQIKYYENVLITEGKESTSWNVIKSKRNSPEAIAYHDNRSGNSSTIDNYFVYAFLPTKVKTGFKFIMNGAFTTDPSRTQIIIDEQTMVSINNLVQLIASYVKTAIENPSNVNSELIELVSNIAINPIARFKSSMSFSDVFKEELIKSLKKLKVTINGSSNNLKLIYNKPEWFNVDDYNVFCNKANIVSFENDMFKVVPSLKNLFNNLDLKEITVNMLLESGNALEYLSDKGRIEILKEYIKQIRFNFTDSKIENFKNEPLYKYLKDEEFRSTLKSDIDSNDLSWFLSKLSIQKASEQTLQPIPLSKNIKKNTKSFSAKFSKWRAVEVNVKAYYESLEDVKLVIDVSKSNLGYDLEVHRKTKVECIEVKSVTNLGDSFSLTNNEYGVANEKKENYILAIAKQSDSELELCLIPNPVENIYLNRRVTRWEWVCDQYAGDIKQIRLNI